MWRWWRPLPARNTGKYSFRKFKGKETERKRLKRNKPRENQENIRRAATTRKNTERENLKKIPAKTLTRTHTIYCSSAVHVAVLNEGKMFSFYRSPSRCIGLPRNSFSRHVPSTLPIIISQYARRQ